VTSEIHGVRADAAADFQNAFAAPALEFRESGNVRFDAIFAGCGEWRILQGRVSQ
jgi:hypothetical protein